MIRTENQEENRIFVNRRNSTTHIFASIEFMIKEITILEIVISNIKTFPKFNETSSYIRIWLQQPRGNPAHCNPTPLVISNCNANLLHFNVICQITRYSFFKKLNQKAQFRQIRLLDPTLQNICLITTDPLYFTVRVAYCLENWVVSYMTNIIAHSS